MRELFIYGMRCRGYSPGCQPMEGLVGVEDDPLREYHDVLLYEGKMPRETQEHFDLDFLGRRATE